MSGQWSRTRSHGLSSSESASCNAHHHLRDTRGVHPARPPVPFSSLFRPLTVGTGLVPTDIAANEARRDGRPHPRDGGPHG